MHVNKNSGSSSTAHQTNLANCETDKSRIISILCRICYDGERDEPIIAPCHCKGTVAFVHRTCLKKWLAESNTTSCELCHHVYRTERTPKYTAVQSMPRWLRNRPFNTDGFRALQSDIIVCTILTPIAIGISYVCIFSADYYNHKRFVNIPAAKWTSVSLLIMISIMLMGYYLWLYMVVRYHGRVWYYCWQRECTVRYIPPPPAFERCTKEEAVTSTANRDDGTDVVLDMIEQHNSDHATEEDSTEVEVAVSDNYVQNPSCSNGRFLPQEISSLEMTKVMDEIRVLHICIDDRMVVPQAVDGETNSDVKITIPSDVGHSSCSTAGTSSTTSPTHSHTNLNVEISKIAVETSEHYVQNTDKYNDPNLYFFVAFYMK